MKKLAVIEELSDFIVNSDYLSIEIKWEALTRLEGMVRAIDKVPLRSNSRFGDNINSIYSVVYDLGLRDKFWSWYYTKVNSKRKK